MIEVFPGGAWRIAAEAPLPAKRLVDGRKARLDLLQSLGLRFESDELPTVDQLDAAMAAWVAYCFDLGESRAEGPAPELDGAAGVVREGYIVQPAPAPAAPPEGVDAVAPV